VQAQ